jgi:hypothetical protein
VIGSRRRGRTGWRIGVWVGPRRGTGHQTEQMVKLYTKRVEQKKLAASAVRKLDRSGGGET